MGFVCQATPLGEVMNTVSHGLDGLVIARQLNCQRLGFAKTRSNDFSTAIK